MIRIVFSVAICLFIFSSTHCRACTSAIVSAKVSRDGNPMLWKHRDSSKSDNYVDTVNCPDHRFDYIALFNAEDSLKREAWAGVNRSGFAIMNTVAGNLKKNKPEWADREGLVMTAALRSCTTVEDFQLLLDSLLRPLGVQTNFGVIDANGNGAYFETDDTGYRRYSLDESESGILIRTNFSCSTKAKGGYGYDRYDNATAKLSPAAAERNITPELFTETLSRDFYSVKTGDALKNHANGTFTDDGFIPRPTSVSSLVIEITPEGPVMWTMLGFPPVALTVPVTFSNIPEAMRRNPMTGHSDECDAAIARKNTAMRGKIVDAAKIAELMSRQKAISKDNYSRFRRVHPEKH